MELLEGQTLRERIAGKPLKTGELWQTGLLSGLPDGEMEAVRHATQTGEPLGSREFLKQLERQVGRRLRVWARGRPRKRQRTPDQTGWQPCLFADDTV
jgi:hypothetical protein